jgi:hypothetical protein
MLLATDEVAQGIEVFCHFVGDQACRLTASTPGAGQDLIEHHLVARKRGSGAARLGTTFLAQITLGCAVIEPKGRRVTGAARSIRVPHESGVARLPERLPRIGLCLGVGARQQRQRHAQKATEQPRR